MIRHRFSTHTLCLAFLLFAGQSITSASEVFQVQWDDAVPVSSLVRNSELRISILGSLTGITVVSKNSTPPTPFDDGDQALLVHSDAANSFWFRLGFRAFEESNVLRGAVEFLVQPMDGSVNIQSGAQNEPWDPALFESYHMASSFFSISLTPGIEPTIGGRSVETDSISIIEAGKNYRVAIQWDFSGPEPQSRFFLNGEPVRRTGVEEPLNTPFSADPKEGINTFRITLGNSGNNLGKVFIGPMASQIDLESGIEQAPKPLIRP